MEDFVAYPSRWRIGLLILGSIAFVVNGLWMAGVFGPPPVSDRYPPAEIFVVGWVSVIFFGMCGVLGTKRLLDTAEELRIGTAGIRWARWSNQIIPWSEITDVTTWNVKRQKFIILRLRNPALFPRLGILGSIAVRFNHALTGGDIAISLTTTDRSFGEAMSAIDRFRR